MAAQNGAGLAAPQIGVPLQVVIFGVERNPRYPDAEPVPYTELVNPVLTPLSDEMEEDWEGCLSVPGLRGVVPRYTQLRYEGFDPRGHADPARGRRASTPASSSTSATTCRHPLPDAHARPARVRLHRHPVPRRGRAPTASSRRRRRRQTRSWSYSAVSSRSSACSSCSRAPSIRNTSSARSPSVLILALATLMLALASV